MKSYLRMRLANITAGVAVCGLLAIGAAFLFFGATKTAASRPPALQQDAPPAKPEKGAPPQRPASMIVEPDALAKELTGGNKPTVVCVGPHVLFEGAHIPGAIFHGAASTTEGMDDLKKWAKDMPKDANIVVYCGCCPLTQCPNVRPALTALRQMGFTKVRVLKLPTDFKTDWIDKGLPVDKGK
jgi:thiosulfate/3-mercaptopyruvate sulfurtransferase